MRLLLRAGGWALLVLLSVCFGNREWIAYSLPCVSVCEVACNSPTCCQAFVAVLVMLAFGGLHGGLLHLVWVAAVARATCVQVVGVSPVGDSGCGCKQKVFWL